MATAARTRGPKARKASPVAAGKASTNYDNTNTCADTTTGLRIQALIAMAGLSPDRARLVASLAWEAPVYA